MSFKFPRLYKAAANLLQKASEEDINVKHILYNDKKYKHCNIKSIYAIVAKVLNNWDIVETLINKSNILSEHSGLNIWRVRVIISELIFDNKSFENPENHTLKTVIEYEEKFKKISLKKNLKVRSVPSSGAFVSKVRFVKVNSIKDDIKTVIDKFEEDGWEKIETAANYQDFLIQLKDLEPGSSVFVQDFHVPEVLVFPPGTELQYHELYTNGSICFMDKSSCLAPMLLAPERSSHVLDMCAAPGLKTIQLASYASSGRVYAVERDSERYNALERIVQQSGAENVTTILQDATKLNVEEFKNVEYILVDPSCTGSGLTQRLPSGTLKTRQDEKTRIEKLAGFQLILLRFALTRFPSAKRVVYSTCSLNVEENENVVEAALNSYNHNFEVVSVQKKLPGWQNFGSDDFQFGRNCVYCLPEVDQTNGFFVAVFERKKLSSDALSYNEHNNNVDIERQFKGKKRIQKEIMGNRSGSLKKSSHECFEHENNYKGTKRKFNQVHNGMEEVPSSQKKIKYDSTEINERGDVNKNGSELGKVKENTKKLNVSQKKRSRKKLLKIKKKLLSKTINERNIKGNDHNKHVKKLDKNECVIETVDKISHKCVNETVNKISKAKLRHMRLKKLKENLASELKNKSKSRTKLNRSDENGNIDSVPVKKKRAEEEKSIPIPNEDKELKSTNFDGNTESNNTISNNSGLFNKETNETAKKVKNKHKKKHTHEHKSPNIDTDCNEQESLKHVQNYKNERLESLYQKREHIDEKEREIKDSPRKNHDDRNEKILGGKNKKKQSASKTDLNNYYNDVKGFDKDLIVDNLTEHINTENQEVNEKLYRKKKKRKHTSDNYECEVVDQIYDHSFDDLRKMKEATVGEQNEVKETQKRKHKKKII